MTSEQKPSEEAMRVWHRIDRDNNRSVMFYTLRQDGWRKGQPVMVNDLMITIGSSIESTADILGTARVIEAAINARDEVDERAQIVKWLRDQSRLALTSQWNCALVVSANAIERGDHLPKTPETTP